MILGRNRVKSVTQFRRYQWFRWMITGTSLLISFALMLSISPSRVSAEDDYVSNKGLDFVRVVHNQKALKVAKTILDKVIFWRSLECSTQPRTILLLLILL